MQRNWISYKLLVGTQNGIATLGNSLEVSYKLKMQPSHDPAIVLLSIYPRKMKLTFTQKSVK